ncbi:MAG: HAD-IIIA family hydrolase [Patescibacteria group bacterium]
MTSPENFHRAQQFQRIGDGLTDARYYLAFPVSMLVACTEADSPIGRVATGLGAISWGTDTFDGIAVRHARSLAELPPTDGPSRDPEADRRLAYGLAIANTVRALKSKDFATATVMAVNIGVSYVRDHHMKKLRAEAEEKGLPVDAIKINKNKTTLQALSSVALTSDFTNTSGRRRIALATYSTGTALGLIGLYQYRSQIREDDNHSESSKQSIIPDHETDNLKHINIDWMTDHGYRALSVDVDNTIMPHHGKEIDPLILMALRTLSEMGMPIAFASNAYGERAEELKEIAKTIHESVIVVTTADVSGGDKPQKFRKPKPDMIIEIAKRLGVKSEELLHAGDQQFKDVLSANRAGAGSLLVSKFGEGGDWRVELLQRPVEKFAMGIIRIAQLRSIAKV